MAKRRKVRRQSKRQKARRVKAYIARTLAFLLAIAALVAVIFLVTRLFGAVKNVLPIGGSTGEEAEVDSSNAHNVIDLNKDGSLTEKSVEDFDTSEYDPEELKEMVNSTIAAYNASGDERIVLKSLEVRDGLARAVIYYKSAEDYAAYNEKVFETGKASELDITGFTLADDKNQVLTLDSMDKIKGNYVMLNDDTVIALPKNIQYISRNVVKTGKKTAEVKKAGINSIIIYK